MLLQEEILKHVRLGGDRDARLLYAAVSEIVSIIFHDSYFGHHLGQPLNQSMLS